MTRVTPIGGGPCRSARDSCLRRVAVDNPGRTVAVHPSRVRRDALRVLTDLPNVGPATAGDLVVLDIHTPAQLVGQNAYEMYDLLCARTGVRHDPCMIDVFLSVTHFMAGDDAKPWWAYTDERKRHLAGASAVAEAD